MSGWIKLHRSLLDWEWYDDINATRVLIHLLVSVNYEDKKWKGILVPAGSLVFSYDTLSKKVNLSVQKLRTALKKVESSGEITRKSTNKYQVVTLVKWDKLQQLDAMSNNQTSINLTGEQQSNNKQVTTTKEYNNIINKESSINTPTKVEDGSIDFIKLLDFINTSTGRKFRTINKTVKQKYKARLKDGYKKEDVQSAITNAIKTSYHKDNNFQYLTPEFFSRAETLDKYCNVDLQISKPKQVTYTNPYKEEGLL